MTSPVSAHSATTACTEGTITTQSHQPTFAAILDGLCRQPPNAARRHTNTELAQTINQLGGDITDGYISHLRNGHRDNPTLHTIEHLATALQVSPAAFIGGRRQRHGHEHPRASFSTKLRQLFHVVYPSGRKPYTPEEVAASITSDGRFGPISASYIRELLTPTTPPNPRLKHLLGLAEHFGLANDTPRGAYFLDEELANTINTQLTQFLALRNTGILDFAHTAAQETAHWSPRMRRQALEAITQAIETADTGWNSPLHQTFLNKTTPTHNTNRGTS